MVVGDLLGVVVADLALEFVDLPVQSLCSLLQGVEFALDALDRVSLLVALVLGRFQILAEVLARLVKTFACHWLLPLCSLSR